MYGDDSVYGGGEPGGLSLLLGLVHFSYLISGSVPASHMTGSHSEDSF